MKMLAIAVVSASPASAHAGAIRDVGAPHTIRDSYIVVLKSGVARDAVTATVGRVATPHSAAVTNT
jgi:hypothetical protein